MYMLFILYDPMGHILKASGFKKNPNIEYATNMAKIKTFFRTSENHTLKEIPFLISFNVQSDYKRKKELRLTTCAWKMQNIQQDFV